MRLLLSCLLLLTSYLAATSLQVVSAPTCAVAGGAGYLEPLPVNGGIALPTAPQVSVTPATRRDDEHRGPVQSARSYEVTGYRFSRGYRLNLDAVPKHFPPVFARGKHRTWLSEVVEFDRHGRLMRRETYEHGVRATLTTISFSPSGARTDTQINRAVREISRFDAAGRPCSDMRYWRAARGRQLISQEFHRYDAAGREVAWGSSDAGDGKDAATCQYLHGTRTFNAAGMVTDEESTGQGTRTHVQCGYDGRRILSYRKTVDGDLVCAASWLYDGAHVLLRKQSVADLHFSGMQHETLLEYYHYDASGQLQAYEGHAWTYEIYPAGAAFYVEPNDPIVTKLNDPYLTVTQSINGWPSSFLHITPEDKRQGDPPCYLRKRYSYDQHGRLESIACFDNNDHPCLQSHLFSEPGMMVSHAIRYAVLRYRYDAQGQPLWTMFDLHVFTVIDDFFSSGGGTISYSYPAQTTWELTMISGVRKDEHGNWTREYHVEDKSNKLTIMVRELRYYPPLSGRRKKTAL